MFSPHRRVVQNEIGQSDLHLRVESLPTSFFLLYLFGMVPSSNVLRMDSQHPSLLSDYLWEGDWTTVDLLSYRGNQSLFEFDSVAFVSDRPFSFGRFDSLHFHFVEKLFAIEFVCFFEYFGIDTIEFPSCSDDESLRLLKADEGGCHFPSEFFNGCPGFFCDHVL